MPAVAFPHRIRLAPALAAGLSLLLSGCGHVPLTTMAKLRNFDIATADPSQLRVAIRAPDWLEPREAGAAILFKLKQGDEAAREERFALEPAEEPAETAQLAGHRLPGERIRAWRIAAAEVARARAFQEEGRAARLARPGRTQFTVATALDGCRRGALREGPILTTTLLRTDAAAPYLPLLVDVDLRKVTREAGKDLDAELPACGKSAMRAG